MFRRRKTEEHTRPQSALPESAPDTPSPVVVIDDSNFFDQTAGRYTIVDFWAPWCGPCRQFAPIFEAAAREHGDSITFGKCNVDISAATSRLLQIRGIPTLVVFGPDGSERGRLVGALSGPQLKQVVDQVSQLATG